MALCPQCTCFLTDLHENLEQKIFASRRSAVVSFKEIGALKAIVYRLV